MRIQGRNKTMNKPMFSNPLETYPGITIDDLNKYLPAILTAEDIAMTTENMQEGLFLANCIDGLKNIPDQSIDLCIVDPSANIWNNIDENKQQKTLQEYYKWNTHWIDEIFRVLKNTGAIYLLTDWHYSGMYHSLLSERFKVQTRITWQNKKQKSNNDNPTWSEKSSDIWFATKSNDFLFNQKAISVKLDREELLEKPIDSNIWVNIPKLLDENSRKPLEIFIKIIEASSFKLNWILDPFMTTGDIGLASKISGRRFIGLESDKDRLLLAMKRIDQQKLI